MKNIITYIDEILNLRNTIDDNYLLNQKADSITNHFKKIFVSKTPKEKEYFFEFFEKNIYSFKNDLKIYFLSVLLKLNANTKDLNRLLQIILDEPSLSINTRYFLLYQLSSITFTNYKISDNVSHHLKMQIYQKIYQYYKTELTSNLKNISKSNRNKKLIFIFTSQFLSLNHAPTKSTIDRAYNLKKLGYEVIIINTTELLSQNDLIPFYDLQIPNIFTEYELRNSFKYLDETIPYFQCCQMPNIEGIKNILNIINEYKPYMAFSLGSFNITADLCSNIIPVATIATVFSTLPSTFSQFHVTGKNITEDDLKNVLPYEFTEKNLIQHLFTSSFKPQTKKFKRKDFNLPEDKFILVLIGTRLDKEVTEEFLNLLLKTLSYNTYLLFVGEFKNYETYAKKNFLFEQNSSYIGYQTDVLAILELCDLYINPKRQGGGMSAVEALHKAIPVITYKFGDVYINVGDSFAIENDNELIEKIKQYIQDNVYYQSQIKLGIEKSSKLTDTKFELKNLLEKIEKNPLFF